MNNRRILFVLALLCSLSFLSMNRSPKATFIENYAPLAILEMEEYGIPASIKLAQAAIETNWGTSPLAKKANNYFGIKCKENWPGDTFQHIDDDKDRKGNLVHSCFRAYPDIPTSFKDHSYFLANRIYYKNLFKLAKDDYIGWAKGLKKAGYATDPDYHVKLINLIEQFDLYKYDQHVLMLSNPKQN